MVTDVGTSISETTMMRNNDPAAVSEHHLLEERPRAVLDAAPVKQNVPPEVLAELRANAGKRENTVRILRKYSSSRSQTIINDPVKVRTVDLRQYDILSIGKEVTALEC